MPKRPWSVGRAQLMSQEHQKTLLFLQLLPPLPTGLLTQGGRGCSQCARDEATGKRRRKAEETSWLSAFTTHEPLHAIPLLGTDPGLPVKSGGMWSYEVLGPSQRRERGSSKAEGSCISPRCSPIFSGGLWPHLRPPLEWVWLPGSSGPCHSFGGW